MVERSDNEGDYCESWDGKETDVEYENCQIGDGEEVIVKVMIMKLIRMSFMVRMVIMKE